MHHSTDMQSHVGAAISALGRHSPVVQALFYARLRNGLSEDVAFDERGDLRDARVDIRRIWG